MIHDHSRFSAARAYGSDVGERVTRFLPLVRKLAWHLSGSGGPTVDVDDLMQAGLVALTECAQKHEGPGEDGFAAYARMRVRGAMVDLLRSNALEPRGARSRRKRIEEARSRLAGALGREPSAGELADALGMTVEALHAAAGDMMGVNMTSIDDCYSEHDTAFASDEPDAETILLQGEDREALIAAIAALGERHQQVVQLYFVEELNLSEIARVLDVSVPRVHQLKAAALAKLRAALGEQADEAA